MDMLVAMYSENNLIGIVILLMMLFFLQHKHMESESSDQKVFIKLLVTNVLVLLLDTVIYAMGGNDTTLAIVVNHIASIGYFSLHVCFGYFWLVYCLNKLHPDYRPSRLHRILLLIPCLIGILLAVTSPWTKWIYYLEAGNHYMRGPLMLAISALSYLYWAVSMVLVVHEMCSRTRACNRPLYRSLLLFPVPTTIGFLAQMVFNGLSLVWICSAFSLLLLFINLQYSQMTRDILTGLFNRRQTDRRLAWEIHQMEDADDWLFVLMIDADRFKDINDRYGHVVGDHALGMIADILKTSCDRKDFIGRFGGDEFLVVGHARHPDEVTQRVVRIQRATANANRSPDTPYTLSLSMGKIVVNRDTVRTADEMVSAADHDMYREKTEKKKSAPHGLHLAEALPEQN